MLKGLGNLANLGSLFSQARELGAKMQQIGEELKRQRVEGRSGGGMVTVEANGAGEVLSCRIDPSLSIAEDREVIEDLIPAAVNQALTKSKELQATMIGSMADLPGLQSLLSQLPGGPGGNVA